VLDLNLQGMWISDRKDHSHHNLILSIDREITASLSWNVVQEEIPAVNFVHKYENVFSFKCVYLELFSTI
jgi:carboxypeptidase D